MSDVAVDRSSDYRQILGVNFFVGSAQKAVDLMISSPGFLVVPSGPGLKDLPDHTAYREALLGADMAITDSALMVLLWNFLERDNVIRVSGLEYLELLLRQPEIASGEDLMWVMAGKESRDKNLAFLEEQGIKVSPEYIYTAPMYGAEIEDLELINLIKKLKPKHVIVTVGGGTQERLGLYIKQNVDVCPGVHCIGAAIAFLSGDQVKIPLWADKLYIGWLVRCLSAPGRYIPRYWEARRLIPLMLKYRSKMPTAV